MRKVIERIWLMHEQSIVQNTPLQERVLWLNIQYAIKYTKSRSTTELGIESVKNENENCVMFKIAVLRKEENGDLDDSN